MQAQANAQQARKATEAGRITTFFRRAASSSEASGTPTPRNQSNTAKALTMKSNALETTLTTGNGSRHRHQGGATEKMTA